MTMRILDIYVPRPLDQWTIGDREYRVCHKNNILVTVTWYELHWAYEIENGVQHMTKRFRSLGELYGWAERQRVVPERKQATLAI